MSRVALQSQVLQCNKAQGGQREMCGGPATDVVSLPDSVLAPQASPSDANNVPTFSHTPFITHSILQPKHVKHEPSRTKME